MVWLFDQQNASEITKYGDPSAFCLEQFQLYQYSAFTLLNYFFFFFFLPSLFCSFCLKKDRKYHNKKRDQKKKKKEKNKSIRN
jgi:uncharacterized membrane protein (DUF106 family)